MKKEEKIIMYDSPEAAKFVTGIEGWVSANGHFWGKNEQSARYDGCTHKTCDCGEKMEKGWTKCVWCRNKSAKERFMTLPFKEWNYTDFVCEADGDRYFFSIEDLEEYMYENEISEIDLLFCEPVIYNKIDFEDIAQDSHEDWEPSSELEAKVKEFNDFLSTLPPHSWMPGKIRTSHTIDLEKLKAENE